MSRPKPKVLMSHTNPKTYITEQVLAVKGIYCVTYEGRPINLKAVHSLLSDVIPKYRRTCFVESPGHARNLAKKLNTLFRTTKFEVWEMTANKKAS
jgi:hypothetical protein